MTTLAPKPLCTFIEENYNFFCRQAKDYRNLPRKLKKKIRTFVRKNCYFDKRIGWNMLNTVLLNFPFQEPLTKRNTKRKSIPIASKVRVFRRYSNDNI